jgi:hypothetical protein
VKGVLWELRMWSAEFLLSCALDVAPRDSRLRSKLGITWEKSF